MNVDTIKTGSWLNVGLKMALEWCMNEVRDPPKKGSPATRMRIGSCLTPGCGRGRLGGSNIRSRALAGTPTEEQWGYLESLIN